MSSIQMFKDTLPYLIEAKIATLMWGAHGIGKSETIAEFCKENGYKYFDQRLGTQDAADMLGLSHFKLDPETGEPIATQFVTPNWLTELVTWCEANPDKKGIIFLDEINRAARKDVLQAVFQIILDGKLHELTFPDNLYTLAAANPDTGDYFVLSMDDQALLDRFCHIKLDPSTKEWMDYAKSTEHDPRLTEFITQQPALLDPNLKTFSISELASPSRRSWSRISKLLKLNPPEDILRTLTWGLVGSDAAEPFMTYLQKQDKLISTDEIINNYNEVQALILKYSQEESGRLDIVNKIFEEMNDYFKENENTLTKEQENNFGQFLMDAPIGIVFANLQKMYLYPICKPCLDEHKELHNKLTVAKGDLQNVQDTEETENS